MVSQTCLYVWLILTLPVLFIVKLTVECYNPNHEIWITNLLRTNVFGTYFSKLKIKSLKTTVNLSAPELFF